MGRLFQIQHPEIFQGNLSKKIYFEGNYFKIVAKDGKTVWAIIAGIALDKKNKSDHAMIQFFDGINNIAHYFKFPIDQFWFSTTKFEIKLGDNYISAEKISLNINQNGIQLKGELQFNNLQRLPKQGLGHNIMGPFEYIPFIQCRHGIHSMDHDIQGTLNFNGVLHDFSGGKGYSEKDTGTSFPKGYMWAQSNHFKQGSTSLLVSIGRLPYFIINVTGFLVVLWWKGSFYRFSNHTLAKITEYKVHNNQIRIKISDKHHEVIVEGIKGPATSLPAPTLGNMNNKIEESLQSTLHVWFYEKNGKSKNLLFDDEAIHAGLEIQATAEQLGYKN